MENRYKIIYDMKTRSVNNIKFKQGDTESSVIEVILTDGILPVNITGEVIEFRFLKADKTVVFQDITTGVSIVDAPSGKMQCILKSDTLSAPGVVKCEIYRTLLGKGLTTQSFNFTVESSIGADGILSVNYISSIETKLLEFDVIKSEYDLALHENTDIEIVNARTGEVDLGTKIGKIDASLANMPTQEFIINKRLKAETIKLVDLDTEVKTTMTGGTVAVVGLLGTGTENIKDLAVTEIKTSFMQVGTNLFDKDNVIIGSTVNIVTGGLTTNAGLNTMDYTEILPSINYADNISGNTAWYDSNKTFISGVYHTWGDAFVSPSNAKYIRATVSPANMTLFQFEQGTTQTAYKPFGYFLSGIKILDKTITTDKFEDNSITTEKLSNPVNTKVKTNIWESGNLDASGNPTAVIYSVRSKNFIKLEVDTKIVFDDYVNYSIGIFRYDDNYAFVSGTSSIGVDTILEGDGYYKFKIVIRDSSDISTMANELGQRLILYSPFVNRLDDLSNKVVDAVTFGAWDIGILNVSGTPVTATNDAGIRILDKNILEAGTKVFLSNYGNYYFRWYLYDSITEAFIERSEQINYGVTTLKTTGKYRFIIVDYGLNDMTSKIDEVSALLIGVANTDKNASYIVSELDLLNQKATRSYDLENCVASWWYYPLAVRCNGVRDKVYTGYTNNEGYSGVASIDKDNRVVKCHIKRENVVDDHNAVSVNVMSDNKIMAVYAGGHGSDNYIHVRISKRKEDISEFEDEVLIPAEGTTTYSQVFYKAGKWWVFYRTDWYDWSFSTSTDGITWTAPISYVKGAGGSGYYCKITDTTDSDMLRIEMYVFESDVIYKNIRQGFLNCTTGDIFNADGITLLGNISSLSVPLNYSVFTTLITGGTYQQRLLDVAVTDIATHRILYANRTISEVSDFDYCLFVDGVSIPICSSGACFSRDTYVGGMIFDANNNDLIYVSREALGVWYIEQYEYDSVAGTVSKILDIHSTSTNKATRPFFSKDGNTLIWSEGYMGVDTFTDFLTDYHYERITY